MTSPNLPTTWTDQCGHHCGVDNMSGLNGTDVHHCEPCHATAHIAPSVGGCGEAPARPVPHLSGFADRM